MSSGATRSHVGYTVEQVSTLLTQISSTFQPKPFDGRCPYLGLDAFSEDDADRFFGRETLVSELVARVKESRFVVIAGPSGSGKSSLVRAGLIHALKQGALPNSDRWLYATLTPGRDPIESLALAMSRLAKSPDAGKYLREHSAEPDALHDFVESQLSDRKDQRAVIFVDQFEEVFTQVSKEDERVAFLNLLTHAATIEDGRVTVLFALRSDFVSNCATYPQLNALLNQQFMQVGAMQPDELVSAIARPALQVGLRIDPDLIAQIVNDMQDEPGALPLMQFALKDLFDAQQAKGGVIALTLNDYLARGGLRKALERHADAAFAKLSESEQQLARTIFSGLIEIGRGTQDTRRTAAFDELVPANVRCSQVKAVVQKLADARLITTDEQDRQRNRDDRARASDRCVAVAAASCQREPRGHCLAESDCRRCQGMGRASARRELSVQRRTVGDGARGTGWQEDRLERTGAGICRSQHSMTWNASANAERRRDDPGSYQSDW